MEFFLLIVITLITVFAYAYISGKNRRRQARRKIRSILSELKEKGEFDASQDYIPYSTNSYIAVDEGKKRFCFIYGNAMEIDYRSMIVDYKDIIESEIIEDNVQVMKTSRSSQIGGALVGGALAGGVGAIIGGLSGKQTTTNNKVRKLDLKVTIADIKTPVISLNFFNLAGEGIDRFSIAYKNEYEAATHWHGLISVAIREAENENVLPSKEESNKASVAEELTKLSVLLKDGLITREEFDTEKQKIMSQ